MSIGLRSNCHPLSSACGNHTLYKWGRIHGRRDIAKAILADQSAPIRAKRRKQFESAWARYCAEGVTPSQPSNVAYIRNR